MHSSAKEEGAGCADEERWGRAPGMEREGAPASPLFLSSSFRLRTSASASSAAAAASPAACLSSTLFLAPAAAASSASRTALARAIQGLSGEEGAALVDLTFNDTMLQARSALRRCPRRAERGPCARAGIGAANLAPPAGGIEMLWGS